MEQKFSQLVWLGAGTATEPENLLDRATRATLLDARETACRLLKKKYPQENIIVKQILLTADDSPVVFTEYNLPEHSATQPATGLTTIFPGLKITNREKASGAAVADVVNDLTLEDTNNLLVVDIVDGSLSFLKTLQKNNQLGKFIEIYVQVCNTPLYADAPTSTEIIDFLQSQGYLLQQTTNNDPDIVWLNFGVNPLWNELQQTNKKLMSQQKNNQLLADDLEKSEQKLTELKNSKELLSIDFEKTKAELKKHQEQDKNQKSAIDKLEKNLEQASKNANNHTQKTNELQKENTKVHELNCQLQKRQQVLTQELMKAEAQIDTIKDLLLKP